MSFLYDPDIVTLLARSIANTSAHFVSSFYFPYNVLQRVKVFNFVKIQLVVFRSFMYFLLLCPKKSWPILRSQGSSLNIFFFKCYSICFGKVNLQNKTASYFTS